MNKINTSEKNNILFISHEIEPYLEKSIMGNICRYLPQGIQESNNDIRTFMPRYGVINERRNQLHEVIRLSGMNLIINDIDHPIIIKVASISQARIQIYFIDNEEYFMRKAVFDDEKGKFFSDNDERAIFFSKGVLETVKKLGWSPDLINCHGWLSAFTSIYLNKQYRNNPLYSNTKIVTTLYKDDFKGKFSNSLNDILKFDEFSEKEIENLNPANYVNLMKYAIDNSDAVIFAEDKINPKIVSYVKEKDIPSLTYEKYDMEYLTEVSNDFFNLILSK